MNAAGRLETAQHALDMLVACNGMEALAASEKLEELNTKRRGIQDAIFEEACVQAEELADDRVLVVSSDGWNHGVIGIVASKLVEKYKKPVFIIGERGEEAIGSARSFGDFSAADAVRAADDIIIKGGGHGAAAGVTLETEKIGDFRRRGNEFYDSLQLTNQERYLLPRADVEIGDFSEITEELIENLAKMEPFGNGNPEPVLKITRVSVLSMRRMGADGQHVKLALRDKNSKVLQVLAFNAPEEFFREPGDEVVAWFQPTVNEWQGVRTVEGRLLHIILLD